MASFSNKWARMCGIWNIRDTNPILPAEYHVCVWKHVCLFGDKKFWLFKKKKKISQFQKLNLTQYWSCSSFLSSVRQKSFATEFEIRNHPVKMVKAVRAPVSFRFLNEDLLEFPIFPFCVCVLHISDTHTIQRMYEHELYEFFYLHLVLNIRNPFLLFGVECFAHGLCVHFTEFSSCHPKWSTTQSQLDIQWLNYRDSTIIRSMLLSIRVDVDFWALLNFVKIQHIQCDLKANSTIHMNCKATTCSIHFTVHPHKFTAVAQFFCVCCCYFCYVVFVSSLQLSAFFLASDWFRNRSMYCNFRIDRVFSTIQTTLVNRFAFDQRVSIHINSLMLANAPHRISWQVTKNDFDLNPVLLSFFLSEISSTKSKTILNHSCTNFEERISFGFGYTAVRAFTIWKAVWELNSDFILKPNSNYSIWSGNSVLFRRSFNEFDKMSTNSAIDDDFYAKIIGKFLKIFQNTIKIINQIN